MLLASKIAARAAVASKVPPLIQDRHVNMRWSPWPLGLLSRFNYRRFALATLETMNWVSFTIHQPWRKIQTGQSLCGGQFTRRLIEEICAFGCLTVRPGM